MSLKKDRYNGWFVIDTVRFLKSAGFSRTNPSARVTDPHQYTLKRQPWLPKISVYLVVDEGYDEHKGVKRGDNTGKLRMKVVHGLGGIPGDRTFTIDRQLSRNVERFLKEVLERFFSKEGERNGKRVIKTCTCDEVGGDNGADEA